MQFVSEVTDEDMKRERRIARDLRKTAWWKRKCADGRCYYCGTKTHPGELTMDHIVPVIRGGRSTKSNIVTACKECNNKKKYMLPMEWEDYTNNLLKA
jgi:5-methylcytosine-specific restriction protein A